MTANKFEFTTPEQPMGKRQEGGRWGMSDKSKAEAILDAIRNGEVGSDIILHNNDMSIWCILTVKCKEHPESGEGKDGGG